MLALIAVILLALSFAIDALKPRHVVFEVCVCPESEPKGCDTQHFTPEVYPQLLAVKECER